MLHRIFHSNIFAVQDIVRSLFNNMLATVEDECFICLASIYSGEYVHCIRLHYVNDLFLQQTDVYYPFIAFSKQLHLNMYT